VSTPDTVSVIIVTFNSASTISVCLRRLKETTIGIPLQVIIVDNGSTDKTLELITPEIENPLILKNEKNIGFAAACNQGAKVSTGDYLCFLNPDTELDSDAIMKLLTVAKSTHYPGLISGRLRYPDGRFQANCRKFPTVTNLFFSRGSLLGRLFIHRIKPESSVYTMPDYEMVTEIPAVAATFVLIKRDLFMRVHGFDPRFFMYMEDTDLSLRLHQRGCKNLFVPIAGAIHGFGRGSSAGSRSWCHHQSVWKYFLKHCPNGFSLILLPVLLSVNFLLSAIIPVRKQR
jgi:N-acetylglucosaminyl-diphospho-decaprenol L-rhamnosyltransferase